MRTHSCRDFVKITDPETGEILCNSCGAVLERQYVRYKRRKDESKHAGPPNTLRLADMGLSTVIGSGRDHAGRRIPPSDQARIKRLKAIDSRTRSGSTSSRNMRRGLLLIERMTEKMAITKAAAEEAAYIFRKAHGKKMSKGRNLDTLAVACLYASCRANNIPRNLTEFSRVAHADRTAIAKMYRLVNEGMGTKPKPFGPPSFVSKLADKLGMNEKITRKAINLIQDATDGHGLVGKRPASIAAAAIYAVCSTYAPKTSLRKISQTSKVSVNTIKKISEILLKG